jgi:acyl dehydratase
MAFACKVIVNHLCENNPARLKRLAVSFSRPVFPGDVITTVVWHEDVPGAAERFSYESYNAAGVPVLQDGLAEIRA